MLFFFLWVGRAPRSTQSRSSAASDVYKRQPVYGTKLTIGIIEGKLEEHELLDVVKRKVVKFGQSIHLGGFRIEFIRTNHSIADAAALAIHTPVGVIVHTGDFKVDYTPVFGDAINLARFSELGKRGVLALMCDSTNVLRPGFTPSERKVGKTFDLSLIHI